MVSVFDKSSDRYIRWNDAVQIKLTRWIWYTFWDISLLQIRIRHIYVRNPQQSNIFYAMLDIHCKIPVSIPYSQFFQFQTYFWLIIQHKSICVSIWYRYLNQCRDENCVIQHVCVCRIGTGNPSIQPEDEGNCQDISRCDRRGKMSCQRPAYDLI